MRYKIILIYIFIWVITWLALLADTQSIGSKAFADETYRQDLGTCIFMGLMPPFWILTPFVTGFYEHGFQIGRRKQ